MSLAPQRRRPKTPKRLKKLHHRQLHAGESLEARQMLTAVPFSIEPSLATQELFVHENEVMDVEAGIGGDQALYKFVLEGDGASNIQWNLEPNSSTTADAAIGLYDLSGNLIAQTDVVDGSPSTEQLNQIVDTGQVYILGTFFDQAVSPGDFQLTSSQSMSPHATPLAIDVSTGTLHYVASSGNDALDSSTDIDYYRLDLTNGGTNGSIIVNPLGLDGEIFAQLLHRGESYLPWSEVDTESDGTGAAVSLDLTAPFGQSLSEGEFLLAVTTEGFDGGPGAYEITIDATPTQVPVSLVNPTIDPGLATPAPTSLGQSMTSVDGSISAGNELVYKLKTTDAGAVELDVTAPNEITVGIYNETGSQLLDVYQNPANVNVLLDPNSVYLLRLSSAADTPFALQATTEFAPQSIALNNNLGAVSSVAVGQNHAPRHFRVTPGIDDDVLIFRADSSNTQPLRVVIASDSRAPEEHLINTGELFASIDVSQHDGALDIFVEGTGSDASVDLQFGVVDIPLTMIPSSFPSENVDLAGQLVATSASGAFGAVSGVVFSEPDRESSGLGVTFNADGQTGDANVGPNPAVAVYRKTGSSLKLVDFMLPTEVGQATLSMADNLLPDTEYAIASVNLSPDGTGNVALNVDGEQQLFVGVQMVPDITVAAPDFESILSIRNITLASEADTDRWKTILPHNILASSPTPRVTLTAIDGSLRARVRVWVDSDGSFDPVADLYATQVMSPSNASLLITKSLAELQGATVYFEVEPLAGQLGSGEYTLEMSVDTTDTEKYLVKEDAFRFFNTNPTGNDVPSGIVELPNVNVVDIVQNQFGDGSAQSSFTNPVDNSIGSVDVFRFWAITPGQLSVRTVGLSENVNTNLRIYKSAIGDNGVEYLDLVDAGDTLGDWYPADRTTIDDQAYINNFDTLSYGEFPANYDTGGGIYYAVAKNEQATLGDYRIEVNAQSFPLLGNGNTFLQAKTGRVVQMSPAASGASTAAISLPYVSSIKEFAGLIPIQMPVFHNGTLLVEGDAQASWKMQLFDEQGNELPGSVNNPIPLPTEALFQVESGPQTVYLRVNELQENVSSTANLSFRTTVSLPGAIFAPDFNLPPAGNERMLLTTPSGDTPTLFRDNMSSNNQVKKYGLQLAAGRAEIIVVSESQNNITDVDLQWAVYVDGSLWSWNDTRAGLEGISLSMLLPEIRKPLASTDFDFDTNEYHDVVIHVTSKSNPTDDGGFAISVMTDSELPTATSNLGSNTLNPPLVLNPLSHFGQAVAEIDGKTWKRVHIPAGNEQMTLQVSSTSTFVAAGTPYVYQLYTPDGALVASAAQSSNSITPGSVTFALNSSLAGGNFYLRTGMQNRAGELVNVILNGINTKNNPANGFPKPDSQFELGSIDRLAIGPTGILDYQTLAAPTNSVFWVGQAGVSTIEVDMGNDNDDTFALYRVVANGNEIAATYQAVLVDYVNGDDFANSTYTLYTYLETGAYLLQAERINSGGPSTQTSVHIQIPQFVTQEVIVEPNSGNSTTGSALALTAARDGFGRKLREVLGNSSQTTSVVDTLRTSHYRTVAPAGTQGLVEALAQDLSSGLFAPDKARLYYNGGATFQTMTSTSDETVETAYSSGMPSDEFFISVIGELDPNLTDISDPLAVGFMFDVPESGVPDLVVEPLTLTPNNGETLVGVSIKNVGYGSSSGTVSRFRYSRVAGQFGTWVASEIFESALGPASKPRLRSIAWLPAAPSDRVEYFADVNNTLVEADETNNERADILSRVDAHRPVVTLTLQDNFLDGNIDDDVYGRYITQVPGVQTEVYISVTDADGAQQILDVRGGIPQQNVPADSPQGLFYNQRNTLASLSYDFGSLNPTTPTNPNEFRLIPRDIYGLLGEEVVKTVQVQQYPGWLLPINSNQLTFNQTTSEYDIHYRNALLDVGGEGSASTLNELVGADIPFVGDLPNRLLAEVGADGSASLDPDDLVTAGIFAHAEVVILGEEIFNERYTPDVSINDYMRISGELRIEGDTLDSDFIAITFSITDLPLFDFQSPEITLFAYGVPGVASINANLQFSLEATLDAAVTVGLEIDDNDPNQLLLPTRIGLASPTFVAPTVVAGLHVAGEVEILGFDIASLTGSIYLSLTPAYGLDSPRDELLDFDEFFEHDCLEVTGSVTGGISAEVIGIEVFDFQLDPINIPFPGGCSVVMGPSARQAMGGTTTILGGNDLVGTVGDFAHPELVIDPATGEARYVQLVDVDPNGTVVRQGLVFSERSSAGNWSGLTPLVDAGQHLSNPVLVLTNDETTVPGLVAYQSVAASDPGQLTRNEYFSGQELIYRYYDGSTWSLPTGLTSDSFYDSDHSLGFNQSGQGAIAWVSNGNATPLDSQGRMDRASNEIKVARWNATTKSFVGTTTLTSNTVGDGEPAVHTAADGTIYVVWVQDTGFDTMDHVVTSNRVMFSVFDPTSGNWSAPAALGVDGLPDGGKVGSVAIGTNGGDRINVLISHSETLENRQVESKLFNRVSTQQGFATSTPVSVVAEDLNFAHLRTTNAPDGSLVAYWMGGDGSRNNVFASSLNPVGSGPALWSDPFTLTAQDGDELPFAPSLAVDTNDEYQLVYEMRTSPAPPVSNFPTTLGHPDGDPAFEAPMMGNVASSSYAELPELGFATPFQFNPARTDAISGSTVRGEALIKNSGLVGDVVKIFYIRRSAAGAETVLRSETVYLSPGQTYLAENHFGIREGTWQYGVRVKASLDELLGLSDNKQLVTIRGLADLAVTGMELSNPNPIAGETISVRTEATNTSDIDMMGVTVQLWQGNPRWEFGTATLIGEAQLGSGELAAGDSELETIDWTVPQLHGVYPLTAVVVWDGHELLGNNEMVEFVKVIPDVSIGGITATLLNDSGINNVEVTAVVGNQGNASADVEVELYHSLDGGTFELVATQTVEFVTNDVVLTFLAAGLAGRTGENRYRVLTHYLDENQGNQLDQTLLIVQGLADIEPTKLTLAGSFVRDEIVMATFDVENNGIATADFIQVEIFGNRHGSNETFLIGGTTIDSLDPLSLTTLTLPVETYPLDGLSQICVIVDRQQSILEVTDMNNSDCLTVTFSGVANLDYGDGPLSYPILLDDNGARHAQSSTNLALGSGVDYEPRPIPSQATSDDSFNTDDEDGVVFAGVFAGRTATVQVEVTGDVPGYLNGWIDFAFDGSWGELGDQIFSDVLLSPGVHQLTFAVPADATVADTFARFRLSTEAGLSFTGRAADGEVEDHAVQISRSTVDGDFNDDGLFDCADIDALVSAIADGNNPAEFDLTGDGVTNLLDRDQWLADGALANGFGSTYLLGDANLDGTVDGSDFVIWSANKFTNAAAWCSADFTADGSVDGHDFLAWNANKFSSSDAGAKIWKRDPNQRLSKHESVRGNLNEMLRDSVFAMKSGKEVEENDAPVMSFRNGPREGRSHSSRRESQPLGTSNLRTSTTTLDESRDSGHSSLRSLSK